MTIHLTVAINELMRRLIIYNTGGGENILYLIGHPTVLHFCGKGLNVFFVSTNCHNEFYQQTNWHHAFGLLGLQFLG